MSEQQKQSVSDLPSTPTKQAKTAVSTPGTDSDVGLDEHATPAPPTSPESPESNGEDRLAQLTASINEAIQKFALEAKVTQFNKMPRPSTKVRNHWVFGVAHVEAFEETDMVFVAHTASAYMKYGGPEDILCVATPEGKAEALIPPLLQAFLGTDPDEIIKFGPSTWSTVHEDLIEPLQEALKRYGVLEQLCTVGLATKQERGMLEKVRETFIGNITTVGDGERFTATDVELCDLSRCHGCGFTQACFFKPLSRCSRCQMVAYHSRDCELKHWHSKHKAECMGAGGGRAGAGGDGNSKGKGKAN